MKWRCVAAFVRVSGVIRSDTFNCISNARAPGDLRRRRAESGLGNLVHCRPKDRGTFLRTFGSGHSYRREYNGSALGVTAMIYLQSLVSGNSAAPGNGTPAVCTLLEDSFTFRRQLAVIPSNCVSNPMKLKYYSIGTIGHKYAHLFHRLFGVVRLRVLGA